MSNIPQDLKYSSSHEWLKLENDNTATIGISDFAQAQLGDIVYIDLHNVDEELGCNAECGVLESVKAASDLYSPVAGKIIARNEELSAKPELVNHDPYHAGWIYKIELSNPEEIEELLDADGYQALIGEE